MRRRVPETVAAALPPRGSGLTAAQVAALHARYGANDIAVPVRPAWREVAAAALRDPMVAFLAATALLFAAVGSTRDAVVMALAVLPILGMDAFLHRRVQQATRALASLVAARAQVLRDAEWRDVAARELVPGDLVQLQAGDGVPADGVLESADGLQVDESLLTGESLPVRKQALAGSLPGWPLVESLHWAAAGTRVLAGSALLRVACTGAATLQGEIVRLAAGQDAAPSALQRAVARLVAGLLWAAVALCLVLAAVRVGQGFGVLDALLAAATLAVAAVPEEFPVVLALFLGAGAWRLAQRHALVRRAVAVEDIGRVTAICTDKTGTLTEGRLILAHREPSPGVAAADLLRAAALSAREDGSDPLDLALLRDVPRAHAAGAQRLHVFPFDEVRRCETVLWHLPQQDGVLAVLKGAPEAVLSRCDAARVLADNCLRRTAALAAEGHKVIAFATLRLAGPHAPAVEPAAGFVLAGLLAFEDPLRVGVRDAIAACHRAGIRVVMVTGDHEGTARAIAREAGIDPGPDGAGVVARAMPRDKLDLVRRLQAAGEVVAVTGDGVNDVPALQAANVGIAMGERGTQAARDAAAIVLLDDDFHSIVAAIGEGRQLLRNLQLAFAYLLVVHAPLVLAAALVPLAGLPLLFLPSHVVWMELLIHPAALLAFQSRPKAGYVPPAAASRGTFFSRQGWRAILLAAAAATIAVIAAYALGWSHARDEALARTGAIALFVLTSTVTVAALSGLRTVAARAVVAGSLASLVLVLELPPLRSALHLALPSVHDSAMAAGLLVAVGIALMPLARAARRGRLL